MKTEPSIIKQRGTYQVRIQTAAGKTKRISTGCASKVEALKVVREAGVEKLTIAAKSGSLTTRVIGQILTGNHLTSERTLDKYMEFVRKHRAANTAAATWIVLHRWLDAAGIGGIPPSAITADHVSSAVNHTKSKWKLTTRRTALGCIRAFFGFCAANGWLVADPSKLVEIDFSLLSHEQKESTRREPFTDAELDRLVAELRKEWTFAKEHREGIYEMPMDTLFWLVAVQIARETGLRLCDVAQVERRSFAEAGNIVAWTRKTGTRIEHSISETVKTLVAEVPDNGQFLFPVQRAISCDPKKRANLSSQFSRLCRRLEVADRGFHSIRRTFATETFHGATKDELAKRLAASMTKEEIRVLLGHKSAKTTEGYIR